MLIKPVEVNYDKTKFIRKSGVQDVLGYWVKFIWNSIEGYAYLIPSGINKEIVLNKHISVETNQRQIQNFRKKKDYLKPILKPLQNPGDYYIVGIVEMVCKNDDNQEIECVYITVEDCSFALYHEEIGTYHLKNGDFVEFVLFELELYDEGIY